MMPGLPRLASVGLVALLLPQFSAGTSHSARVSDSDQQTKVRTLEDRLQGTLADFDASGRPMVPLLLELAYKYKLPMALECATSDAVYKPVNLRLKHRSLRDTIRAIVAIVPGLQVNFSGGLVDVYAPKTRLDPSNPFNTTVGTFDVVDLDTHRADAELLCALIRQRDPHTVCTNSIAPGQWGDFKITLHLRDKKLYEVLNAIVARNGGAVWTPTAPPRNRSGNVAKFWYIYPLDPAFQSTVVQRLESAFPRPAGKETR